MLKKFILFLIICILFSSEIIAQNLSLKIEGVHDRETQIIDSLSYLNIHKDYLSISSELKSIQQKLYKLGFIESTRSATTKLNDTTFHAEFNLKHQYKNIHIYYNDSLVSKQVLEQISNQVSDSIFVLPFNKVEDKLYFINSEISDQGLPFSTLQLSNIEIRNSKTLKATLTISENSTKRSINNIIVKGYDKFPKSYLKHYLKIKPGQSFNLSEIKNKTESLNDLSFANQIKEPEVLFTKDSTTLYLYLEKTKSNSFDGFLGFGSNEETNTLEFTGYLNLGLNNNLNFGESFRLLYKSEESDQKTFNVNLNLPYLFNSPLGTEVELNIFKKDSSFSTVNQIAKLYYPINSKTNIYLGINSTQSNNLLDNPSSSSFVKDYNSTLYSIRLNYIRRQKNNRLFNTNTFLDIEFGLGKRTITAISENQTKIMLNAFKIFNLNKKNSAYLRLNSSGLFSDTYVENELFRFGGINSIRGFEENSLTASLFGILNTEYRYQLNNSIYVHSITDFSYFENKITDQKEKLYSFGFGFGLITKAGLLKFNYANGKSDNQEFKLSNSKIHLSLTAFF